MPKHALPSEVSDDDAQLFQQAVEDVVRLRHKLAPPQANRVTRPRVEPEDTSEDVDPADELQFLRPGIQRSALQKLRRGQFRMEATLDLHGLRANEAKAELQMFLHQCQARGRAAVRIVHGKGHGSEGRQPVLKARIGGWLRETNTVLAFCSARPQDGGTGAVDVLLRR